jgi:hypothetical protein
MVDLSEGRVGLHPTTLCMNGRWVGDIGVFLSCRPPIPLGRIPSFWGRDCWAPSLVSTTCGHFPFHFLELLAYTISRRVTI